MSALSSHGSHCSLQQSLAACDVMNAYTSNKLATYEQPGNQANSKSRWMQSESAQVSTM